MPGEHVRARTSLSSVVEPEDRDSQAGVVRRPAPRRGPRRRSAVKSQVRLRFASQYSYLGPARSRSSPRSAARVRAAAGPRTASSTSSMSSSAVLGEEVVEGQVEGEPRVVGEEGPADVGADAEVGVVGDVQARTELHLARPRRRCRQHSRRRHDHDQAPHGHGSNPPRPWCPKRPPEGYRLRRNATARSGWSVNTPSTPMSRKARRSRSSKDARAGRQRVGAEGVGVHLEARRVGVAHQARRPGTVAAPPAATTSGSAGPIPSATFATSARPAGVRRRVVLVVLPAGCPR